MLPLWRRGIGISIFKAGMEHGLLQVKAQGREGVQLSDCLRIKLFFSRLDLAKTLLPLSMLRKLWWCFGDHLSCSHFALWHNKVLAPYRTVMLGSETVTLKATSFLHIYREIVLWAAHGQAPHLSPVFCLFSVPDESHHCVICKPNEEVWAVH